MVAELAVQNMLIAKDNPSDQKTGDLATIELGFGRGRSNLVAEN
jgi:hypothetical protein